MRLWACLPLWTAEIKDPGNLEQSQSSKICPFLATAQHRNRPRGCVLMTTMSEVNEKREKLKERSRVKINS